MMERNTDHNAEPVMTSESLFDSRVRKAEQDLLHA